jgi:hypothetical protein
MVKGLRWRLRPFEGEVMEKKLRDKKREIKSFRTAVGG